MIEETVWIPTRDGKKLEGLLRQPAGHGPFPAVVFVSGLGMSLHEWNNSFDEIAQRLNEVGILTLQFQFDIFKPDGSVRELPLSIRAQQLADAFNWFLARPDVDPTRIGTLAQSFGVATVLSLIMLDVAKQDLNLAKPLIFISGSYFPQKSTPKVYEERGVKINYSGITTLPRSSGEFTTVGKDFWLSLASFDPIACVQQLTQPVLVIHGDQDTKIPVSDVEKAFAAIASKQKKLKIFRGGDHGITDVPRPTREEFLRDVVEWFEETLK